MPPATGPTEDRPCPACLAGDRQALGEVNGFAMRRCRACGTLFTARLPSGSDAEDYEAHYKEHPLEVPAFVHERLRQLVDTFERSRRENRWLDVGFGAGTLMRAVAARGWAVTGTEVASRPVEALAAEGFAVHLGTLDEIGLEAGSFDVVSLIEVVEHVPDPGEVLTHAAALVRPGGAVYLTTPHGRGLSGRLLGTGWSVVSPPEHLQLLSVAGLRSLLSRAGLRPFDVRTHGLNPYELWHALRRREGRMRRVSAAYALNERLTSNRRRAAVKTGLNAALSAMRAGDTLKCTAEPR